MSSEGVYSIWLVPEVIGYRELTATLAHEFSAPVFEPHITIIPEYSGDLEDVKSRISGALSGYRFPLQISLTGPHTGESYYRSVYYLVDKTPQLNEIYSLIRGQFGSQPDYFPHLSLIYGDFTAPVRKQISRRAEELSRQLSLPMSFPVSRITVFDTGSYTESVDRVSSWRFATAIPQRNV